MRIGWFRTVRKGVAGLLVLVLLALSATPAVAWPSLAVDRSGGHHHAADCGWDDSGAVPSTRDPERPAGGHDGHGSPAIACCVALQCPMLLADLRAAPAGPLLPVGPGVGAAAPARHRAGLDIPPALPPPRAAV